MKWLNFRKLKLILIILFLSIFLISCKTTISEECLNFFKSLENQKFWSKTPFDLILIDESGKKQNFFENKNEDSEIWIQFMNIEYKQINRKKEPIKAIIILGYFDGKNVNYSNILVNDENKRFLENILSYMETDEQRKERLINEKYESLIKEGKKLLEEDKITLSIEKFNEAKKLKDTLEVNKLLDAAYFERGEYFFNIGEIEKAKEDLEKVKYDSDFIDKAFKILEKIKKFEQEREERISKNIKKTYDEFKKITLYNHVLDYKMFREKNISIFPYIKTTVEYKSLYLSLTLYRYFYQGWLFAYQIVAIVNDKTYETPSYSANSPHVFHDVWDYGVFEYISFPANDTKVAELIKAIVDAPLGSKIKFRVYGEKGYVDYTLTEDEHLGWKDIMYLYNKINLPTKDLKGSET